MLLVWLPTVKIVIQWNLVITKGWQNVRYNEVSLYGGSSPYILLGAGAFVIPIEDFVV